MTAKLGEQKSTDRLSVSWLQTILEVRCQYSPLIVTTVLLGTENVTAAYDLNNICIIRYETYCGVIRCNVDVGTITLRTRCRRRLKTKRFHDHHVICYKAAQHCKSSSQGECSQSSAELPPIDV